MLSCTSFVRHRHRFTITAQPDTLSGTAVNLWALSTYIKSYDYILANGPGATYIPGYIEQALQVFPIQIALVAIFSALSFSLGAKSYLDRKYDLLSRVLPRYELLRRCPSDLWASHLRPRLL